MRDENYSKKISLVTLVWSLKYVGIVLQDLVVDHISYFSNHCHSSGCIELSVLMEQGGKSGFSFAFHQFGCDMSKRQNANKDPSRTYDAPTPIKTLSEYRLAFATHITKPFERKYLSELAEHIGMTITCSPKGESAVYVPGQTTHLVLVTMKILCKTHHSLKLKVCH